MISLVEGKIVEKGAGKVVLSAGGVGYEALVPTSTFSKLPAVGKPARLHTRLQLKDDTMVLYGFSTSDERALFDMLVKVTGVGPRYALAVLSALDPDSFRKAVVGGDVDAITVVPGIGKKVAGRIILDLKDKMGLDAQLPAGPLSEVREALLSLGLSPQEARDALASVVADDGNGRRPVEELLKEALQSVGRA